MTERPKDRPDQVAIVLLRAEQRNMASCELMDCELDAAGIVLTMYVDSRRYWTPLCAKHLAAFQEGYDRLDP